MLFRFGIFWKTMAMIIATWTFYGIFDFEFTTITLLALILTLKIYN